MKIIMDKLVIVALVLCLLVGAIHCSDSDYIRAQWATAFGSASFRAVEDYDLSAVAHDANGNTYAAGRFFVYPAQFGKFKIENEKNTETLFFAKLASATGEFSWVKTFKASTNSGILTHALLHYDVASNLIYFSGSLNGTLSFSADHTIATERVSSFLAKFDADGNFQAVKVFDAIEIDQVNDASNAIPAYNIITRIQSFGASLFISGKFVKKVKLSAEQEITGDASHASSFVARLASNLIDIEWAVHVKCSTAEAKDLAIYYTAIVSNGNTLLVFGDKQCPITLNDVTIPLGSAAGDNFIMAFSAANGVATWGKALGASAATGEKASISLALTAISPASSSAVIVAGKFAAPSAQVGDVSLEFAGKCTNNYYIAKVNADNGAIGWVQQGYCSASATAEDLYTRLALTVYNGNIALVGFFRNGIQFKNVAELKPITTISNRAQFVVQFTVETGALVASNVFPTDVEGPLVVASSPASEGKQEILSIAGASSTVAFPLNLRPEASGRFYVSSLMNLPTNLACPMGTYGIIGTAQNCTACPDGTYNGEVGAILSSDCLDCKNNTISTDDKITCKACPPNYTSGPRSSQCVYPNDLPLYMIIVIIGVIFASGTVIIILCAMTSQIFKAAGIRRFSQL